MTKIISVKENTDNSIFLFINKNDGKIHINVTIKTFFLSNMAKITNVRQNNNNSIYLLLNQK